MQLELTVEEAMFLKAQLTRHLGELDDELIHTDAHALQHELARDGRRLRALEERLAKLIEKK